MKRIALILIIIGLTAAAWAGVVRSPMRSPVYAPVRAVDVLPGEEETSEGEGYLSLEGDFSGYLSLEGDHSGYLSLE